MSFEGTLLGYTRKSFHVTAVRVDIDNVDLIAAWCKGKVARSTVQDLIYIELYTDTTVQSKRSRAFLGDWIVYNSGGFKHYKERQFRRDFELRKPEKKVAYEDVIKLVRDVAEAQDKATYHSQQQGMRELIIEKTKQIFTLFEE